MFKSVNEHVIRTHTKPETRIEFVLVAIAVFFSPLNYFRPGFVFFTLGDFFILLAFFVVLFKGRLPLRPLGSASTLWFASVLTFLAGFAAASIINGDAMAGALGLMQYCFSFVLLPWIILRRSRKETETLIFLFVLSIALAMVHGAYYVNFVPGRNDFVSGNGRLSGLFEKENESGVLAALSLVFLVWLRGVHRVTTLGAILLFLPVTYGVLLTGSNTAFYLCIVGVTLFVLLTGSVKATVGLTIGVVLFFIAAVLFGEFFLPEVFQERVFSAVRNADISESGTIDDRLFLVQESMKFGNETLWLGYGIDQYEEKSAIGAPVHNAYLLTLTEGGAVSLVGLAGLFASGIYVIWRYKMMMGGAKDTALAVTILMMLMMVLNTSPHFYARFWLVPWMLGLSVCLTGREIKLPLVGRPLRRAQ
ncbi:O-antigen ligase [uncultured Ruegeria sp.]|uniref:O-antigen ligase family protein n=1 Tax=uncultured Ruegeria sp. TaxID=259304 RepID=UPI0026270613|nr:O-antigen ligase family protein [uncultured Ruegeria sp.]